MKRYRYVYVLTILLVFAMLLATAGCAQPTQAPEPTAKPTEPPAEKPTEPPVEKPTEPPAEEPGAFEMLDTYHNISTTAVYSGALGLNVTITYDDTEMTEEEENGIALLHLEQDGATWDWVDCTVIIDTVNNLVTGHVSSLGWFGAGWNLPPVVGAIACVAEPIVVGTEVAATVSFADHGDVDSHTATWDWGDNTGTDTVGVDPGFWEVSGSHVYTAPGVYTIQLTVTDEAGKSDTDVFRYVVIYDPEGGFVTGGGWIDSPAGAFAEDPTLAGKASFGFVSKYKKGADVPTGQTQFQFKVADLNFHSSSYQWLVVAGPRAQFKGDGTINGTGNYGFMLIAIDEALTPSTDVDMFRIKIWDKATDEIVYDNQMGEADDADAITAIGGGSIVIHKK